jgi:hypothetical protein
MNDLLGLLFFVLLIAGIFAGLKFLSRPQKRTEEEFERKAAEGSGTLGAGMFALQKLLNPEAAKATEVQLDLKGGRYNKKKREGKASGNNFKGEENDRKSN